MARGVRRRPNGAEPARTVDFQLVTQYYPPERGAAQVRLSAVVAELVRAGLTVDVVTALPNYPLGRIFAGWSRRPVQQHEEGGAVVTRVWVWAAMGSGVGRILNYLSFGVMSLLGIARARRARWVLVEYPTLFGALPAVVVARLRRQHVAVIVADLWVDAIVEIGTLSDGPLVALLRRAERWMLRRADTVTAVTEGVRDALVDKGVDGRRLSWLPNGADTELFSPGDADPQLRASLGLASDEHLFLYAGTHGYVHGLEVVLAAAELLRDEPVRFLLVGGGSEKQDLVRRAAQLALTNVEFRDPVDPAEVARLLRVSTAGLATVREGDLYRSIRSAKVLPTMAAGRPVIYSADDEGSRLVAAAGAGLVTPAGDAAALADAIRTLVADPADAERMGRNGREWVLEHASWGHLVDEWLAQLGERPSGAPVPAADTDASR